MKTLTSIFLWKLTFCFVISEFSFRVLMGLFLEFKCSIFWSLGFLFVHTNWRKLLKLSLELTKFVVQLQVWVFLKAVSFAISLTWRLFNGPQIPRSQNPLIRNSYATARLAHSLNYIASLILMVESLQRLKIIGSSLICSVWIGVRPGIDAVLSGETKLVAFPW